MRLIGTIQHSYQKSVKIPFIPKETFTLQANEVTSSYRPTYRQKHFKQTKSTFKQQVPVTQKDWVPQHILKDYNMYCTNAFLIRSWTEEEKIQIQNGCRFQGSIPIEYVQSSLILEVELMFYELSNPKVASFKTIAVTRYLIENFLTGVYEYVPVIFNEDHFHLVNTCIYASLLGFKFKGKEATANGPCIQSSSMKALYQQYVNPLRQSFNSLTEFLQRFENERQPSKSGVFMLRSQQQLPLSCDFQSGENIARQVATEFQIVESQINSLWMKMLTIMKQKNGSIVRPLKREQILNQQMRFASFTHRETINIVDHVHTLSPLQSKMNQDLLECTQKRSLQQKKEKVESLFGPSKVIDMKLLSEIKDQLVIMEKHYLTSRVKEEKSSGGKIHLIVFVHGYQGHPFDMRLFENYLCMRYPQHMFMISISNQNSTEGDILQMGMNLAHEVTEFINQWCSENCLQKVSFISHSLGGLIVRAALPHLNELSDKCFSLVTLGSPHIGYAHNSHNLIKFGLWIMQAFKKSLCLTQLTLKDSKVSEQLCLMKLSMMPGLSWFKHIILIGSKQDHYVSQESALIMKISEENELHNKMAYHILKNMTQNEIIRINIDYNFENRQRNLSKYNSDFDTFLGRKAHIAILESHFLIQYLIYNLGDYFR